MAQISKAMVDSKIRSEVFQTLHITDNPAFVKINDRQAGILVTDVNGHQRFARVAVIVAEEREDMTAEELMNSEIAVFTEKQQAKASRKAEREAKAKRDAEKRAKLAAEKAAKAAEVAATK